MKGIKLLLIVALSAMLFACDKDNDPRSNVDYDKMIGTWTLNSYTEKWVITDDNTVEIDNTINQGTLIIEKKQNEEQEMHYFYKENFLSENGDEYEGMISIENGYLNLRAIDGFNRNDIQNNYEYTVSFPSDNKMEWTCNWTGTHSRNGIAHQDKRTVKGIFTKQ